MPPIRSENAPKEERRSCRSIRFRILSRNERANIPILNFSRSTGAYMPRDPSEEEDPRTDPTRCPRDADRLRATPDRVNSAHIRQATESGELLLDTSCPKWRNRSLTVPYDLTYCVVARE